MNTIQMSSLKFIIASMAIAASTPTLKPVNAQRDRVHEIGWSSRLSSMGLDEAKNLGKHYTFSCQSATEETIYAPIWGTDNYTPNSGICTTAVHAGMIMAEEGGEVTVQLVEGEAFYTGSYKNEVTSQDHRATDISFTFIGEKLAQDRTEESAQSQLRRRQTSGIERVMVQGVQKGVERSIEKAIIEIFR